MFAFAVADAAFQAGRNARFVIAHDAESMEHFRRGQFHLFHVAIEVDGILCDARGPISAEKNLLSFMKPPVPPANIDRFDVGHEVRTIIRRKTRWTVSFEKYAEDAMKLLATIPQANPRRGAPRPG